jgi:hypothetical protein
VRAPLVVLLCAGACARQTPPPPGAIAWRLVQHETFDTPFAEPAAWQEDTYGPASPYHVDDFDDDGAFFVARGGETFRAGLAAFRSFRKSFTHGQGGWLTVELYGRDADRDGVPESGGRFVVEGGKARLVSGRHTDGAIIRSTVPLPARYRVQVTVSNIAFGGGPGNGYDGDERADPWRFTSESPVPVSAATENGVYFLAITDHARPAPHNNVFIHHHRKVVMDTDNNQHARGPWSEVWNPLTGRPEPDGERYVGLIWLSGAEPGADWTGNELVSYTPGGFQTGPVFVDKYLPGETYVFAIERDGQRYTLSVSGRFHHGGQRTYAASRRFTEPPVTWHYNQRPAELAADHPDTPAWPRDSAYPDHFLLGDPHINFYEGTAEFDDLQLFLPE